MDEPGEKTMVENELSVSFGYKCTVADLSSSLDSRDKATLPGYRRKSSGLTQSRSFSCLSGAALNANATLANSNVCNGVIGDGKASNLDSPTQFKRITSSSSLSVLDCSPSSSYGSMCIPSDRSTIEEDEPSRVTSLGMPSGELTRIGSSSFLEAMGLQMAGGAAGEDRVQAVCSEENGLLFCGVYDGFNGRDAADFLAKTLYESICFYLYMLDRRDEGGENSISDTLIGDDLDSGKDTKTEFVKDCLTRALAQAETDYFEMVEREMEDRPDLVSVGTSVLVMLLYDGELYVLSLGDSRAILATSGRSASAPRAVQLTEIHTVDDISEWKRVTSDHPNDPSPIYRGKVKGRLKLTRAFGVGYLKKTHMNNVLIGILRIRNLISPPYISSHPFTFHRRVQEKDQFVVLGSDGLFDFFSNEEVVQLVHLLIHRNPTADPAKYLIEQLVQRAAARAGFSIEDLMRVPAGSRRNYHDDVTVIVIILGVRQKTSSASVSL